MRKLLVIVNPIAGKGAALRLKSIVEKQLKELKLEFQTRITEKQFDAQNNIKEWVKGFTEIVAVGGDGTLNEIVNGLYPDIPPIRLISAGTGNDFAKALDPVDFYEVFKMDRFQHVDLFTCNDSIGINALGLGFDGEVVKAMDEARLPIRGMAAYMIFVLYKLMTFKPPMYSVQCDGEPLDGKYFIASISNGKAVGGGFYFSPKALADDSKLNICFIKDLPIYMRPVYLVKVVLQKHVNDKKNVLMKTVRNLKIESSQTILGQLDGQLVENKSFKLDILPKALKILCWVEKV